MLFAPNKYKLPKLWLIRLWALIFLASTLFGVQMVRAADTGGAAISEGYQASDGNLATGTLVSLELNTAKKVQAANTDREERLVGVVGDKPLLELSGGGKEIQIVISGTTLALVSDINGDIMTGDKIAASPINGVGMKATETTTVVGTAQADFSDAQQLTKHFLTDRDGNVRNVQLGLVPVQVNVTQFQPKNEFAFLPAFMQNMANAVAGRNVSPLRVLLSSLIMLIGMAGIGVLLYASVRSSIISIGRNPLSEGAVHKSLLEVGGVSLGILIGTLIAIYLILIT